MNYSIILFIFISICIVRYRYGLFSIVSFGLMGFIIYSIPAIVGFKVSFAYPSSDRYFIPVDGEPILVTLTAWIFFTTILAIGSSNAKLLPTKGGEQAKQYGQKMWIALTLSLLGILYLIAKGGALFFFDDRADQVNDPVIIIWRWIVIMGFLFATLERHRIGLVTFFMILAIIFLRGDRTIPAIATISYFVVYFREKHAYQKFSKVFLNYRFLSLSTFLAVVVIFGKSIYISVKQNNFQILADSLNPENLDKTLLSLEPFVTFDHIPWVIDLNVKITFSEFLTSVFGNLLIVPSTFGVSTNLYNDTITAMLPFDLSYGVAGNYWAHAMSVGGYVMVAIFAAIYAGSLIMIDRNLIDPKGRVRLSLAVIGALIAIYIHRNGLDNILSFVRQIFIATALIHFCALFCPTPSNRRAL